MLHSWNVLLSQKTLLSIIEQLRKRITGGHETGMRREFLAPQRSTDRVLEARNLSTWWGDNITVILCNEVVKTTLISLLKSGLFLRDTFSYFHSSLRLLARCFPQHYQSLWGVIDLAEAEGGKAVKDNTLWSFTERQMRTHLKGHLI